MSLRILAAMATTCALAWATAALAHVTVTPNEGKPGAHTMIKIHLGHGCDGMPITGVRIDIPREFTMAHPQEIDGWDASIKTSGARVTSISWTAIGAAPETAPDFEIHAGLPGFERTLYLPVTQTCGAAVVHWNQKPAGSAKALEHPAPTIKVTLYPSGGPVLHMH